MHGILFDSSSLCTFIFHMNARLPNRNAKVLPSLLPHSKIAMALTLKLHLKSAANSFNSQRHLIVSCSQNLNPSLTLQRGVNLFELFAKHQPGVAGCGWLQPGRNLLST